MALSDGSKTVTAAGTAEALASTRTIAQFVTIQALADNTNSVYIGDSTVGSGRGIELPSALDSYQFAPIADLYIYNLADIFIDVAVSGEGVKFTYGGT